jgi:hypothetical protein
MRVLFWAREGFGGIVYFEPVAVANYFRNAYLGLDYNQRFHLSLFSCTNVAWGNVISK